MTDYKELIECLRGEADAVRAIEWDIPICTSNHILQAADAIEQLVKERDVYAKAFRIKWSDEPLINHAVVKIDYADIIAHSTDELVYAIAYRLASVIEDARSAGGRT